MKVFAATIAVAAADASTSDLLRANRAVPRDHVRANTPAEIRKKLNAALQNGPVALPQATACEEFSLDELAKLQIALFNQRSSDLPTPGLRAPRHSTAAELEAEHREEAEYARKHPEVLAALRDGRCAEITMNWVHQVSEETRRSFSNMKLPLLANKGTEEHAAELKKGGHHKVAKLLETKVTCQTGHMAKTESRGTWEGFPAWPYEVEYNASGYGPYPFWGRNNEAGSYTQGTPIHTYWSGVLNAERLEHGNCGLTDEGFAKDGPCTHLFLGTGDAYLFLQDETECCVSGKPGRRCNLNASPRDLTSVFSYDGEIDNYVSESGYYSGKVKKYSTSLNKPSGFYFWYVTDMDDRPIEQGEGGCNMYGSSGSRCSSSFGPKYIFHQYDPENFKEATLDPEVFAVPDVCKTTTKTCYFPSNFCSIFGEDEFVV